MSTESRKRPRRDRTTIIIAVLALLIAVGHVVYAFIRDHVLD